MPSISRAEFKSQYRNKQISVVEALQNTELKNLDLKGADLNGDGHIRGDNETQQLFNSLDSFDKDASPDTLNTGTADSPSQVGRMYRALQAQTCPIPANKVGDLMCKGGKANMDKQTKGHQDAIDKCGVGLYYGDHSEYKSMNAGERKQWIKDNTIAGQTASTPKESSCIGWAMENVKEAYQNAGKGARWREIERKVYQNGSKGTDLAKELQKDGWQGIYFNPDTTASHDNGEHSYTAHLVSKGKPYYGIKVKDSITNYASSDPAQMDKLKDVPFYFGLAQGGQHTFVGGDGKINEFHWDRNPNEADAIEETPLKDFGWSSGILMVPPGTWK